MKIRFFHIITVMDSVFSYLDQKGNKKDGISIALFFVRFNLIEEREVTESGVF